MAPEMIKKEGHDKKIDIWAIGVLLYEMVFGKPPFSVEECPPESTNTEMFNMLAKNILV